MSKLDELMALVEDALDAAFACATNHAVFGDVHASRAAIRDALKAVVQDAERYRWLREQHTYNGEDDSDIKRWFVHAVEEPVPCDPGALDECIDAARKP